MPDHGFLVFELEHVNKQEVPISEVVPHGGEELVQDVAHAEDGQELHRAEGADVVVDGRSGGMDDQDVDCNELGQHG